MSGGHAYAIEQEVLGGKGSAGRTRGWDEEGF